MSMIEAKQQLRVFSNDQRRELVAFLFDLQEEENEAAELTRLHAEMDAGQRVSLQDCLKHHDSLLARGL